MTHRFVVVTGVVGIVVGAVLLALVPIAAQAPTGAPRVVAAQGTAPAAVKPAAPAKAKAWTPASRTPDGQPDLQGFWTNTTYTPLERPKNINREFFTKEEALEVERRAAEAEGEQTEPGTVADVHYDFTQFGLDRNQGGLALNLRT